MNDCEKLTNTYIQYIKQFVWKHIDIECLAISIVVILLNCIIHLHHKVH